MWRARAAGSTCSAVCWGSEGAGWEVPDPVVSLLHAVGTLSEMAAAASGVLG